MGYVCVNVIHSCCVYSIRKKQHLISQTQHTYILQEIKKHHTFQLKQRAVIWLHPKESKTSHLQLQFIIPCWPDDGLVTAETCGQV